MGRNLSAAEVGKLKKWALQGYTPKAISEDLGCAVSTVHHYKNKLSKEEGLQFPKVKGKRPAELPQAESKNGMSAPRQVAGTERSQIRDTHNTVGGRQAIQFVVNGVTVQVAPGVKSIEI